MVAPINPTQARQGAFDGNGDLILTAQTEPGSLPNLFSDSFESADLSASQAGLNTVNFAWTDSNRTGIITQEGNSGRRVWPTQYDEYFNDGNDWTAKDGSYSMSLEYGAGVEIAEQRFNYNPQTELWVRYWVRVPHNYQHGATNPTNQKWFYLWCEAYGGGNIGPEVGWEFWNDGSNGGAVTFYWSEGGGTPVGSHNQQTNFISYPADQGRWMQVVFHVKASTTSSSYDGIIQFYRRWENESNFTLIHEKTDTLLPMLAGSGGGWQNGYVLGWANSAYAQNTYWLVDKFEMSSDSLL